MTRHDITLRGADAERFEEQRDRVAERRGGYEPSSAEVLRMMMTQFDPEEVC